MEITVKELTFNELKLYLDTIDYPAGRVGPITIDINNKGKKYQFDHLKVNYSGSDDYCGVGLNHSYQPQHSKKSKFHDSEDISVDIGRDEFISCMQQDNELKIKTKTWTATLTH